MTVDVTASSVDQIRKLLAQWMQADDSARDDEWLEECLDQNFSFTLRGQVFQGRAAVREMNSTRHGARGVHILSEPVIDIDGDSARSVTAFTYFTVKPDGEYAIALVGTYDDKFLRDQAGRWWCVARSTSHLVPRDSVRSDG
jgi:hypothetical protein